MAVGSEAIFGRFIEMIEKHFDVYRDGPTKVLHLHRRTTERESASLFRKLGIGEGDFGLYTPESSVGWWGVRKPILEKLKRIYGEVGADSFGQSPGIWLFLHTRRCAQVRAFLVS